jgi:hypothetical protein
MITSYFYEGQLRSYLLQFCNIFAGLTVKTGKGECAEEEFISVPIAIGSRDRVVAAIQAGNTQNKPFTVPSMVANMAGLEISSQRKGIGVVDRRTFLPAGGVYPADLKTVTRVMPIPYIMTTELAIIASNTQQMHQILEQLLVLFDPILQIQTSDAALDWTKIASVELTGINNEENYPPGGERRLLMWTLTFATNIWLSAPVDMKDDVVRKITLRIGDLSSFQINEYDDEGNLVPFTNGPEYGTIDITG